jgi:hypothetical protein
MKYIGLFACAFSALCLLASCAAAPPYARLDSALALERYAGKKVELKGRISDTPWQHLVGSPAGFPYSCYFDVDRFQIVVYSKTPIACPGALVVRGTVVEIRGSSKRPGTKADESWVEYHLAADSWECGGDH